MFRSVLLIVLVPLLGACTLIPDSYGCKGMPNDPICMSTERAYQVTDNALPAGEGTAPSEATKPQPVTLTGSGREQSPVPHIEDPTPIRTPSEVMRIWIAPWEDKDGDLNVSGYVFTEIEPRRWMIGKKSVTQNPQLRALQVEQREPPKKDKFDLDGLVDGKKMGGGGGKMPEGFESLLKAKSPF
ncbi:TraV family lipoprotein [Methylomonas koyamae]|uniref:TraV family lipoprotein n=1 Tax=Methylomonas koyamae TaxID=702114 RepID=UPI000BC3003D|nr:TraV family lipoprotein [Methylomonas koyamae]ATG92594.1 conjugal transfer protein TraV [Methylomonas koyamae]